LLADPGSYLWCRLQLLLGDIAEDTSMERALEHYAAAREAAASSGPSPVLADALQCQANVLVNMYRVDEGAELAQACLDISRGLGYTAGVAWSLFTLSYACFHAGHADEALSWARQAIEVDRAQIPGVLSRMCGVQLVNAMRRAGDGGAALRTCADVMAQATAADDLAVQVMVGFLMADLERQAGRAAVAAAHLNQSLQLIQRIGIVANLTDCLETCGHLCADRGQWADAVTIWSAETALQQSFGRSDTPLDAQARQLPWQKASKALGPARMRAAEQRGASMPAAAAAELAIVLTTDNLQAAPGHDEMTARLSTRERELVALVAQGRTDTQIAGQLYITVSTVRSHLDRIRDKTGSRRRADLTRLALAAGLV
jgi:DNA-binding CsgD family transcriptional regulator